MGSLIPLNQVDGSYQTGDVYPGFQSQDGSLILPTFSLVPNSFIRFTSGVAPADLLMASMASSHILYIHLEEVGVGFELKTSQTVSRRAIHLATATGVEHNVLNQSVTPAMLASPVITRMFSCVNARGIPPAA